MAAIPAGPAGMPEPWLTAGVADSSPPWPAQRARQSLTGQDVCAALAKLSAERRRVIVEIYYRRRSVADAADLLCLKPAQVVELADSAVRQLLRALATGH